ncbi:MAG: anthranilate phosphoribosyltransferase [Thermoplasmata archaeon]|nr:anthranilate phosphoribosyltransferase [Thermoplasmata archaeon]TFG70036.1 MAG: anthranilate phosphoribosyltransferase [Methanomassiliicoccus sp.]
MIQHAIRDVVEGKNLSTDVAQQVMREMMDGASTSSQIASFATAMRMKGETQDELLGFAKAMRERATPVSCPPNAVDLCGTGGDGSSTFNISTVSSFVVAAAGVPVAKHGNRAVSSRSGSADLLTALGIPADLGPDQIEKCVEVVGIGFMFAPRFHEAMRNVAATRREIGFRTFFNILGPISNPAGVRHQLIGIYDPGLAMNVAGVLRDLGTERALVVHGDGLDEITDTGPTSVVELNAGRISRYEITPESFGFDVHDASTLVGGSPEENARIALSILKDKDHARSPIVAMNAGAALYVSGHSATIEDGIETALKMIHDGHAFKKLVEFSSLANELEKARQMSEDASNLRGFRIHPEVLRSRCSDLTADLLSVIRGTDQGDDILGTLDQTLFSTPNVLSVIVANRILRLSQSPSVEGAQLNHSRTKMSESICSKDGISLIAEYKPRSPSTPPLRVPPNPISAARILDVSGASGVSVLVEPDFFGGGEDLFASVRSNTSKPMLFKDFVVKESQIRIARSLGADAILLIAKALTSESLDTLIKACVSNGVEPLVETHDSDDLAKLSSCRCKDAVDMIGVNSRDLRTLDVDLEQVNELRKQAPPGKLLVAESGVRSAVDLRLLRGFDAVLMGSSLMGADDLQALLSDMVSVGRGVVR